MLTLQNAKDHLKIDFDDADEIVTLFLKASAASASRYIGRDIELDDPNLEFDIKAAILLQLSALYDGVGSEVNSRSFCALLHPYRVGLGV